MFKELNHGLMTSEEYFRQYPPGTDHDGVMCDLRMHVLNYLNKQWGTNYTSQDMRHFDCVRHWALSLGYSMSEAVGLQEYTWYHPDFVCRKRDRIACNYFEKIKLAAINP
jgi:hypothetical protein